MDKSSSSSIVDEKWEVLSDSTEIARTSEQIYQQVLSIFNKLGNGKEGIIANFGYAGFDIVAFRKLIINKIDSFDSLVFLIVLFLVRGNNVTKIKNSTNNPKVFEKLYKLVTKLSIKTKAAGKTQTITLSRIAISFPEIVAFVLLKCPDIPGAVRLEAVKDVTKVNDYPSLARQPALACFLPKKNPESTKMLNVFLLCNMMISEAINSNNEKWNSQTEEAKVNSTKVRQLNAFNSVLFSETERDRWCEILNITIRGDYSSAWRNAAKAAEEVLTRTYRSSF